MLYILRIKYKEPKTTTKGIMTTCRDIDEVIRELKEETEGRGIKKHEYTYQIEVRL